MKLTIFASARKSLTLLSWSMKAGEQRRNVISLPASSFMKSHHARTPSELMRFRPALSRTTAFCGASAPASAASEGGAFSSRTPSMKATPLSTL